SALSVQPRTDDAEVVAVAASNSPARHGSVSSTVKLIVSVCSEDRLVLGTVQVTVRPTTLTVPALATCDAWETPTPREPETGNVSVTTILDVEMLAMLVAESVSV